MNEVIHLNVVFFYLVGHAFSPSILVLLNEHMIFSALEYFLEYNLFDLSEYG